MSAPLDVPITLPEQRRIHVRDYDRMAEAGIFEDERVELLEGVLVPMSPPGEPHSWVIQELTRILVRALPDAYRVRPQLPVTLGEYSVPEPDLAVVTAAQGERRTRRPEEVLLAIEVSYSSLRYDRSAKGPVYARAGIPEYWIVDVVGRAVEVHRDPDSAEARYRSIIRLGPEAELSAVSVPLPTLRVVDILP